MQLSNLKITQQPINDPLIAEKQCRLSVLRLDQIHPVISGNKLFKLTYFLEEAITLSAKKIITFGGAYSNHLVAAAFACRDKHIPCIGIVRGEQPARLSHTLQACIEFGMGLQFVPRDAYDKKESADFLNDLHLQHPGCYIIPEGGFAPLGAKGAAVIHHFIDATITHIVCAVGTATTVAGLLAGADDHQQIIAIPVLKGMTDIFERVTVLLPGWIKTEQLAVADDYHFGGYARRTPDLISFMNRLFAEQALPTDFVYTGKMMFGTYDLLEKNYFPAGSNICCIHTGGLQGNVSLPTGTLTF